MTCSRAEARCILFDPTARNISTRGSVPITQPRPKLDARQEINEHMLLVGKLHPLLVHFPIGLVLAAAGSELVAMWTRRQSWRAVAVANLLAGAAFSALTLLAGWVLASASRQPSRRWARRWRQDRTTLNLADGYSCIGARSSGQQLLWRSPGTWAPRLCGAQTS